MSAPTLREGYILSCTMERNSAQTIDAVLILDADGERILSKYYIPKFSNLSVQQKFEKNLFAKTGRTFTRQDGTWLFAIISLIFATFVRIFTY